MQSDQQGYWEIVSTDVWDKGFLDLVGTAHIFISSDGTGNVAFGALNGEIDGAYYTKTKRYEFSWAGSDEGDPVSGRGWIEFKSKQSASGHIYIHMGEESSVTLEKQK